MTEQIQNLSMELIEKASEKYSNIREVVVKMEVDGVVRPFVVEVFKIFSPVSIKQCVQEFINKMDMAKARDKEGFGDIMIPYLMFLIVKHFTTLKLPNTFAQELKAIEHMTNTGTLFQIMMYMDENEVSKVKDEINFVLENFDKNLPEFEEIKKAISKKLANKDLVE